MEEVIIAWERLEYAKLKVRTSISFKVDISEEIMINGRLCQVLMGEEIYEVGDEVHRGWYNGEACSNVSSSMDTIVSEIMSS